MSILLLWVVAVLALLGGVYWWTARPDRPYWDAAFIYHALGSIALIAVGVVLTIAASIQTAAR